MSEPQNICIYHKGCPDGTCAAAIIARVAEMSEEEDDIVFLPMDYEDDIPLEKIKDRVVMIVDYSFKNMRKVEKHAAELIWIDHHQSARDRDPEFWHSDIVGLRSVERSAAALTWMIFFPETPMPGIVKYIEDADLFTFKYVDTDAINESFRVSLPGPRSQTWQTLFDDDAPAADVLNRLRQQGKVLLSARQSRIEQTFKDGRDCMLVGMHKCRLMNTNHDISKAAEYAYTDKNYPTAAVWHERDGHIKVSLRSSKDSDIDVAKIAQRFGGGGHKHAAGFSFDRQDIKTWSTAFGGR